MLKKNLVEKMLNSRDMKANKVPDRSTLSLRHWRPLSVVKCPLGIPRGHRSQAVNEWRAN